MTIAAQHVRNAINHLRAVDPTWRSILKVVGPFTVRLEKRPLWWLTHHLHCRSFQDFAHLQPAAQEKIRALENHQGGILDPNWDADQRQFWVETQAAECEGHLDLRVPSAPEEWTERTEKLAATLGSFRSTILDRFLFYCWGELDSWPAADESLRQVVADFRCLDHFRRRDQSAEEFDSLDSMIDSWAPFRSVAAWYLERWAGSEMSLASPIPETR
jgi:hypothetical protein